MCRLLRPTICQNLPILRRLSLAYLPRYARSDRRTPCSTYAANWFDFDKSGYWKFYPVLIFVKPIQFCYTENTIYHVFGNIRKYVCFWEIKSTREYQKQPIRYLVTGSHEPVVRYPMFAFFKGKLRLFCIGLFTRFKHNSRFVMFFQADKLN